MIVAIGVAFVVGWIVHKFAHDATSHLPPACEPNNWKHRDRTSD